MQQRERRRGSGEQNGRAWRTLAAVGGGAKTTRVCLPLPTGVPTTKQTPVSVVGEQDSKALVQATAVALVAPSSSGDSDLGPHAEICARCRCRRRRPTRDTVEDGDCVQFVIMGVIR